MKRMLSLILMTVCIPSFFGMAFGQTTIPSDLNNGDEYRLIFVTSGTRNATSTNIADYNSFVTGEAASLGITEVTWTAVASTETVSAKTNTGTGGGGGVPIYNLNDQRVADDYNDLWDGSLDIEVHYTQNGAEYNLNVWTGTTENGEIYAGSYLGNSSMLCRAGHASFADPDWISQGGGMKTGNYGLYALSSVLVKGEGSLSVNLSSFSAIQQDITVVLNWTTESEIDNSGFIIERKTNSDWTNIASYVTENALKGRGNTSGSTDYTFCDTEVDAGKTYSYRLSDVDFEGNVTIKDIISITLDALPELTKLLPAKPNPFNPSTKIQYTLAKNSDVTLKVVNMKGQTVHTIISGQNQTTGSYSVYWNGQNQSGMNAPSGIYLLVLNAGQIVKSQKIMLVR